MSLYCYSSTYLPIWPCQSFCKLSEQNRVSDHLPEWAGFILCRFANWLTISCNASLISIVSIRPRGVCLIFLHKMVNHFYSKGVIKFIRSTKPPPNKKCKSKGLYLDNCTKIHQIFRIWFFGMSISTIFWHLCSIF